MNNKSSGNQRRQNLQILVIVTMIVCVLLIARFFELGISKTVNNRNLTDYQISQNQSLENITDARRGGLYDINGQPIALDTTSYTLYATLKDAEWTEDVVKDSDKTAKILSKYIDMTRDNILKQLTQSNVAQVEFGRAGKGITSEVKEKIEKENLPGITFVSNNSRHYVNDYFASHLIGYADLKKEDESHSDKVGVKADILEGKLGIELAYDKLLSGVETINNSSNQLEHTLVGTDLHLTLNSRLQNYMEELMSDSFNRYKPEEMTTYLVDIKTGKLLTAAQRPTFNLNNREGIQDEWRNLLVEQTYEPGSTIKMLTMMIAYDEKLYKSDETYRSGHVDIFDQRVSDYNLTGWGDISFEEGFVRSSNVAMVELVKRLGDEVWADKLKQFGFGSPTNSGLPNEVSGELDFDNPVSRYMSSFGQGFSATPIQLLQAYSCIGNKGKMLKIHYLNEDPITHNYHTDMLGQRGSEEACENVLKLMENAVELPFGTAKNFKNDHVKIAAKTGTAEIGNQEGTGYLTGDTDYYFSVVAFYPADEPQYMLYMSMKRPSVSHGKTGMQMLAEIFHPFVDYTLFNQ